MRANRRGRYHPRQLSEKQINFFPSLHFHPLHPHDGQLLTKRMCTFIGVDVSCQSKIRRMQNWRWKWWGNPHAYICQLIKGQSEGYWWCRPLEIPPLFTWKAFMPRLHLPYLLSFSCAPSFPGAQPGRLEEECWLLGRLTTKRLRRSSRGINCFIHGLLNKLFIQEVLSFRATLFQTVIWLTLFRTPLHPLLREEEFKCWKCRTFYS